MKDAPRAPWIPEDVTADMLERPMRAQLRSLSANGADLVARPRVMAARELDADDPDAAFAHAMAAQRRAGRVAAVREAVGIVAYRTGRWAEALSELRAARRMSGNDDLLPMMADAERGLGRPERALALASSPEAERLDRAGRIEMAIVVSGARRDLGQADAAVLAVQLPELEDDRAVWSPRLRYAYADALLGAGREAEALSWFSRAAAVDQDGVTDADERVAELQGTPGEEVVVDLLDDDTEDVGAGVADDAGGSSAR